jgi:hypothetical protein
MKLRCLWPVVQPRLVRFSSFSGKARVRILLLQFVENFRTDSFHHLRCDRAGRKHLECFVKDSLDHAETPLTHDESLRDIDTADRNGHDLRLVSGWNYGLVASRWPGLKISFPKVAGRKIDNQPKDEAANNRANEIAETEIPSRLELGSPSNVLASGTLDDLPESNIGHVKTLAALGTVQIVPNALVDIDGCTVCETGVFRRCVHSSSNSLANADVDATADEKTN